MRCEISEKKEQLIKQTSQQQDFVISRQFSRVIERYFMFYHCPAIGLVIMTIFYKRKYFSFLYSKNSTITLTSGNMTGSRHANKEIQQ